MQIKDKKFEKYIPESQIQESIRAVANKINADYHQEKIVFIVVLNGAFMFAADLMKNVSLDCEISFVKVKSFHGTTSTGEVHELIGLNIDIKDRHVIVVEDIVDSGLTLKKLNSMILDNNPTSLEIATLLYKPDAFEGDEKPKYIGMEIPNRFIVGYGLDYLEEGRNTRDIYVIQED